MQQGTRANFTGDQLEELINAKLLAKGYAFVDEKHFLAARCLNQPIYTRQMPLSKSIYNVDYFCDFVIYHPTKFPNCLDIEAKWQESGGSVDEKYPYVVATIKQMMPCPVIIVLDGQGYRPEAESWLRSQVDDKLFAVFNLTEFQRWANSDRL